MCMTNEAAAIKLAERDNLVGELVEALECIIESHEAHDGYVLSVHIQNARDVIAKAREGAQS